MQLDQTRIPIRERSYLNLLDLSLRVCREYAGALFITSLLGAVPMIAFNTWLIGLEDPARDPFDPGSAITRYVFTMTLLVLWEIPLAAAPTVLYLGQSLFLQNPSARELWRLYLRSLPQMLVFHVLLRGVLTLFCGLSIILHWVWPYLNEVILLERNSLTKKRTGVSTWGRCANLHTRSGGETFGRWILGTAVGLAWIVCLWFTFFAAHWLFVNKLTFDAETFGLNIMWVIYLQIAIWAVMSYLNVVRFLSYLDLRIRSEGWEVELRLRAEAARLSRSLS